MSVRKKIVVSLSSVLVGAGMISGIPQASASPWSEGCLTWHDTDGSCVGARELKEEQMGMKCGAPAAGGVLGLVGAAVDPGYRDDCIRPIYDQGARDKLFEKWDYTPKGGK